MINKKVLLISAATIIFITMLILLTSGGKKNPPIEEIRNGLNINFDDAMFHFRNIQFTGENINYIFSESFPNKYTGKFFKHLQRNFKNNDLDNHLSQVKIYLAKILPKREMHNAVYDLYKQYVACELELIKGLKNMKDLSLFSADYAENIKFLYRSHQFRRDYLGKETADMLYGTELKLEEYNYRKTAVVFDKDLPGAEKDKRINNLKNMMWGEDAGRIHQIYKPYNLYQEKLIMFRKELNSMKTIEKKKLIKKLRMEFFTPEIIIRMEKVDDLLAREKEQEEKYFKLERNILSNQGLSDEQKHQETAKLQQRIFGKEAEAFRRRQNVEEDFKRMYDD